MVRYMAITGFWHLYICDMLKVQACSPLSCSLSESLLALNWLLVDTSSPDPGLPHHHVVCEAAVDAYSVTKMKNVLGAERNLFKIPKTDMIKLLKLFFRW